MISKRKKEQNKKKSEQNLKNLGQAADEWNKLTPAQKKAKRRWGKKQ